MEKFRSHINHNRPAPARGHSTTLRVGNSPNNGIALTNCVAVHPADFPDNVYVSIKNEFVFTTKASSQMEPGTIGLNGDQRMWTALTMNQEIAVQSFDMFQNSKKQAYLGEVNIEISFRSRNKAHNKQYDPEELAKHFLASFDSQVLQPTQNMIFEFQGSVFTILIQSCSLVDLGQVANDSLASTSISSKGILISHTIVNFFKSQHPGNQVNLKQAENKPRQDAIIRPDFKFEDMGIGGLDTEFTAIFRRAFASRIFPPGLVTKLGITHVKGMLLFGPPGTGKTLIARRIGQMLNAKEPKIVSGPEILSKYVGSSEENIRNLFKDAESDYKRLGDDSPLHIIIFDELDSVFKQRGSRGDGTGVADNVVNQLLAKMDGVDQLNNILVIGMTNRRDLIDEALLRPGRFDVQVEISLPDEFGRKQILGIKTKQMKENNMLGTDVDLNELAYKTKNFSGAELEGLVKSATSFSMNRHIKVGTMANISDDVKDMKVTRSDFLSALEEVKPAFGANEQDLESNLEEGIIRFSENVDFILSTGSRYIKQITESKDKRFISLLMHGPPSSGKTALASSIALQSKFPFIRLISPSGLLGKSEFEKIQFIDKTFRDAHKSPLSVIVVDNLERLLEYANIGPRFSNQILQFLLTCLCQPPPEGKKLMIISTSSSYTILQNLGLLDCFDNKISVPAISTLAEFERLMELKDFSSEEGRKYVTGRLLELNNGSDRLSVGVKKALVHIDTARFDEDELNELVELMISSTL